MSFRTWAFVYGYLHNQEGAGHGGQFYLAGGDGITAQVGQFPILAQNQIAAVQGHDGSTLDAVFAVQNPNSAIESLSFFGAVNRAAYFQ